MSDKIITIYASELARYIDCPQRAMHYYVQRAKGIKSDEIRASAVLGILAHAGVQKDLTVAGAYEGCRIEGSFRDYQNFMESEFTKIAAHKHIIYDYQHPDKDVIINQSARIARDISMNDDLWEDKGKVKFESSVEYKRESEHDDPLHVKGRCDWLTIKDEKVTGIYELKTGMAYNALPQMALYYKALDQAGYLTRDDFRACVVSMTKDHDDMNLYEYSQDILRSYWNNTLEDKIDAFAADIDRYHNDNYLNTGKDGKFPSPLYATNTNSMACTNCPLYERGCPATTFKEVKVNAAADRR